MACSNDYDLAILSSISEISNESFSVTHKHSNTQFIELAGSNAYLLTWLYCQASQQTSFKTEISNESFCVTYKHSNTQLIELVCSNDYDLAIPSLLISTLTQLIELACSNDYNLAMLSSIPAIVIHNRDQQ